MPFSLCKTTILWIFWSCALLMTLRRKKCLNKKIFHSQISTLQCSSENKQQFKQNSVWVNKVGSAQPSNIKTAGQQNNPPWLQHAVESKGNSTHKWLWETEVQKCNGRGDAENKMAE